MPSVINKFGFVCYMITEPYEEEAFKEIAVNTVQPM